MSSSIVLRARSNRRRPDDSDIKQGKAQEKNKKTDRRDTQNMGGLVEDLHRRVEDLPRRSGRNKPNSNSDDDSDMLPKKRGTPLKKKEKIDRKDTKLGGLVVEGLPERCSRSKRKFITEESNDESNIFPRKRGKRHGKNEKNDAPPSEQLILRNVASSASPALVKPTGNKLDMAWEWNSLKDINNRQAVTCDFCLKTSNGGITRAKKHQIGLKGDVSACKEIPPSIKQKIKRAYEKKKAVNFVLEKDDEVEKLEEINNIRAAKRRAKRNIMKGSMDMNMHKILELSNKITGGMANKRKTSIRDASKARARANRHIAQFIYRNGIPFEVARSKGFKKMIKAVGDYGQHLNPPSYHKLGAPLLKYGEATEDEPVLCDDNLTSGVVGDAIEASEPSRLTGQPTELAIAAPIEEEKEEEKHDENPKPKPKPKPKPEVTKVYVRKRWRSNALVQV